MRKLTVRFAALQSLLTGSNSRKAESSLARASEVAPLACQKPASATQARKSLIERRALKKRGNTAPKDVSNYERVHMTLAGGAQHD